MASIRPLLALRAGFLALVSLLAACAPSAAPSTVLEVASPNLSLPTVNDLFSVTPVSTTFADSYAERSPQASSNFFQDMLSAPRRDDGRFVLAPGWYVLEAESFCLQAGTHGPSQGDGYLPAPLRGDREAIVYRILSSYAGRVPQQDAQVLLWAILARTRYSDMPANVQRTAATLLSPQQLLELNGGALGSIPDGVWRELERQVPAGLRQVYAAERQLRNQLLQANSNYQSLENIAILAGAAPAATLSRNVAQGQWAQHPEGYFIRYLPRGYRQTRVEVYVAEREVLLDLSATLATPANTSAQRLGLGTPAQR